MDLRLLTLDDHAARVRLGAEAFGSLPASTPTPEPPTALPEGREVWGAFEGERLVACVGAHSYRSWWHGREVATCGLASVSVTAEHRGSGLLRPLVDAALGAAAARGVVVSTLFPTASGIYRSFGYELVASLDTVEIGLDELARVRPPVSTRTRRATADDVPAVRAVHDRWAAAQNGPLTRTGPLFATTDTELVDQVSGISLAVDDTDRVVGYAVWDRGTGYDPGTAVLEVHDLVATTLDGYRALWRLVGSFSSVVGRVRLTTSGADVARLALPSSTWKIVERHPYMLRVDDPAGALTAAGLTLPGGGRGTEVVLAVTGDRLGRADGCYRLELGPEPAVCERVSARHDVPTFTMQGLALAFSGAQTCANLRLVDHLTGPDTHDRLLDAVLGGRPLHIRDYF